MDRPMAPVQPVIKTTGIADNVALFVPPPEGRDRCSTIVAGDQ